MSNKLPVAVYARVSSDHQARQGTIESQLADLRTRVEQDGFLWPQVSAFVDDGHSGETLQRPALERLRDGVAMAEIGCVYIHSPDRLARRYACQVLLLEEFRRKGVEVIFFNHRTDASPEGELLLQIQGVIAEYERAKIQERMRRGRRYHALRGDVGALCRAPFGYLYRSKCPSEPARFEIEPEAAETVRLIFEWFVRDGLAISAICRRLTQYLRPTASRDAPWRPSTVWTILRHPAYMGRTRFGRTRIGGEHSRNQAPATGTGLRTIQTVCDTEQIEIPVPPIIEEETFLVAQERLENNRQRARSGAEGPRHLLQGLLVCGQCGRALVHHPCMPKNKKPYFYYRCTGLGTHRWGGVRVCSSRQVRAEALEQAVWQDACQVLENPVRLQIEWERRLQECEPASSLSYESTRRLFVQAEQGLQRLIDGFQEDS